MGFRSTALRISGKVGVRIPAALCTSQLIYTFTNYERQGKPLNEFQTVLFEHLKFVTEFDVICCPK